MEIERRGGARPDFAGRDSIVFERTCPDGNFDLWTYDIERAWSRARRRRE
jgi:hypothetical protein